MRNFRPITYPERFPTPHAISAHPPLRTRGQHNDDQVVGACHHKIAKRETKYRRTKANKLELGGANEQSLSPLPPPPQTQAIEEMNVAVCFSQEQLQLVYDAIDADTTSTEALSVAAPLVGALQIPSPLPHLLTIPPSPPLPLHPQTSLEEKLARIFYMVIVALPFSSLLAVPLPLPRLHSLTSLKEELSLIFSYDVPRRIESSACRRDK
ncbi:hypothetical protein HF086_014068 [Spodoptera exigua]|uniref:Uncharacterized protein n=1 Tax=Spodoptera exigua TaxID=7107 RepID=A0A922MMR1_SPOEX|nr:hypothetical protein HF086_014068 [Spodoptera exigua]